MVTLVYLFSGMLYRLVGIVKEGTFIGFEPGTKFQFRFIEASNIKLEVYKDLAKLFGNANQGMRQLKETLDFNPRTVAKDLRTLFKFELGVKVIIPLHARVFKAIDRQEMERMGFEMAYYFEEGKLVEKAVLSFRTNRGWALDFAALAKERGMESTITDEGDYREVSTSALERVVWKTMVTSLEDARAIHAWTTELDSNRVTHFALLEWGYKTKDNHLPVIAKIDLGRPVPWICFLKEKSITQKGLKPEDVIGETWKVTITPPTIGSKAGLCWLQKKYIGASV